MKHELLEGVRYWFTAEEESELKEYNKKFQRRSMMEEILYACFRPAMTEDKDEMVQRLSAADIFKVLKKQNPAAMRGVNPNAFAQQLAPLGYPLTLINRAFHECGGVKMFIIKTFKRTVS